MPTEKVLVLPRAAVPGGCDFRGLRQADADDLSALRLAVSAHGRYLDRRQAEEDPAFKQLIPYVVVRDGERIFLMERTDAGGDVRLHGRASIGVGGHLNPVDAGDDALMAGLRREWNEEIDAAWEPRFELVGLLNDETNPVGAVHLGVVFNVRADGPLAVRERAKLVGSFASLSDLARSRERLESWSALVSEALGLVPAAEVVDVDKRTPGER